MNKTEYRELLKDGRWQRRRLEIMQRDDFKCRQCGTTNDLNVHHIRYIDGHKPWEYEDGDLVTLCGKCHKEAHELIEQDKRNEEEFEEYMERVDRGKHFDGLFLYYEKIGDLHDVITTMRVDADDYPALYNLDFYWCDVMPYSKSWRFSGCAGANPLIFGTNECKEVAHHVWHNAPDSVLTKEQFETARKGFNIDKETMEPEEWNFLNDYYFDYSEKKYNEKEARERQRAEEIRILQEQHNQRIMQNRQKEPVIVQPKMSFSWQGLINRK